MATRTIRVRRMPENRITTVTLPERKAPRLPMSPTEARRVLSDGRRTQRKERR